MGPDVDCWEGNQVAIAIAAHRSKAGFAFQFPCAVAAKGQTSDHRLWLWFWLFQLINFQRNPKSALKPSCTIAHDLLGPSPYDSAVAIAWQKEIEKLVVHRGRSFSGWGGLLFVPPLSLLTFAQNFSDHKFQSKHPNAIVSIHFGRKVYVALFLINYWSFPYITEPPKETLTLKGAFHKSSNSVPQTAILPTNSGKVINHLRHGLMLKHSVLRNNLSACRSTRLGQVVK